MPNPCSESSGIHATIETADATREEKLAILKEAIDLFVSEEEKYFKDGAKIRVDAASPLMYRNTLDQFNGIIESNFIEIWKMIDSWSKQMKDALAGGAPNSNDVDECQLYKRREEITQLEARFLIFRPLKIIKFPRSKNQYLIEQSYHKKFRDQFERMLAAFDETARSKEKEKFESFLETSKFGDDSESAIDRMNGFGIRTVYRLTSAYTRQINVREMCSNPNIEDRQKLFITGMSNAVELLSSLVKNTDELVQTTAPFYASLFAISFYNVRLAHAKESLIKYKQGIENDDLIETNCWTRMENIIGDLQAIRDSIVCNVTTLSRVVIEDMYNFYADRKGPERTAIDAKSLCESEYGYYYYHNNLKVAPVIDNLYQSVFNESDFNLCTFSVIFS